MLHGGPIDREGRFNPSLQYRCDGNRIFNSLVAMSVTLTPQPAGAGGFVVVKGSHKMAFPPPEPMLHGEAFKEFVEQPVTAPGDVIFFSEATLHGSAPWTVDHQRRIALYRFAPAGCAYGRAALTWPESYLEGCTEAERSVLEPAYAIRLDRPCADADGTVVMHSRSAAKKEFDRDVFGTEYF